jgi:hypothetical protein
MFRTIDPKIAKTKTRMEFVVVEPQMGDYIMIGTICMASIPLSWYTTPNLSYFFVCLGFYWILAYSLLEDRYVTVLDTEQNTVEVTKTKLGKIEWIRASPADELINVVLFNLGRSRVSNRREKNHVPFRTGIHV